VKLEAGVSPHGRGLPAKTSFASYQTLAHYDLKKF
jgi:hypothetical protein